MYVIWRDDFFQSVNLLFKSTSFSARNQEKLFRTLRRKEKWGKSSIKHILSVFLSKGTCLSDLLHREDHASYIDRILTILVHRDLFAIEVGHIAQRLEERMAVPSEHEVDATCMADDHLVAHALLFPTEMRDEDHQVTFLLVQLIGHLLSSSNRVEIFRIELVLLVDKSFHLR